MRYTISESVYLHMHRHSLNKIYVVRLRNQLVLESISTDSEGRVENVQTHRGFFDYI